ncbi:MAG: carbonate dehydratase [Candidatus Omnitrophota bacterium]
MRWNSNKDYPQVDKSSFVDPTAVLIGKVHIGKNVLIAPGAVIRADEENSAIYIADNCNVQDRAIIHALGGSSVRIGVSASLSHGCIVHGPCVIGEKCFVGFGSVVFKSELADKVFVGHLAVIEGVDIGAGRFIKNGAVVDSQIKAKKLKRVSKTHGEFIDRVLSANMKLVLNATHRFSAS